MGNTGTQDDPVLLGSSSELDYDTDGTLAANSDSKIATQKAVKTYVGASAFIRGHYKGVWSSTYNGGAGYAVDDIVSYFGALYRCVSANIPSYNPLIQVIFSFGDWEYLDFELDPGPRGPASTGFLTIPEKASSLTTMSIGTTTTLSNQKIIFTPFTLRKAKSFSAFNAEIVVANVAPGLLKMGLYIANGTDGRPGMLLANQASQISATIGIKNKAFDTGNLLLPPAQYYVGFMFQSLNTGGTNPTLRAAVSTELVCIPGGTAIPSSGANYGYWTSSSVSSYMDNPTCTFNTSATPPSLPIGWLTAA